MKKFFSAILLSVLFSGTVSAQSLDQLFKMANKAIETVTGNNLSSSTIIGTWTYSQPSIKLESENMLAQAGAAALSKSISAKLVKYYEKVGIKAGLCTFTFSSDNTFIAKSASKTISGTWSLASEDETITLTILNSTGAQLGQFNAKIYKNEGNLVLAFQANKILSFIQAISQRVNTSTANGIAAIAKNYEELAVGFEFKKDDSQ